MPAISSHTTYPIRTHGSEYSHVCGVSDCISDVRAITGDYPGGIYGIEWGGDMSLNWQGSSSPTRSMRAISAMDLEHGFYQARKQAISILLLKRARLASNYGRELLRRAMQHLAESLWE